ncbi:DUF4145 domain-containing protein [Vibrio cholerae]
MIKKIYCNICKHDTNHEMKGSHDGQYMEEENCDGQSIVYWFEEWTYSLWACRGCDSAVMEYKSTYPGMSDSQGNTLYDYRYHPPRITNKHRETKRFRHIDQKLNDTYRQLISAFNQDLNIVVAIGIRALIEGICVQEGIGDDLAFNLGKKLSLLEKRGHIPSSIIQGLKSVKVFGDDAAHRLASADKANLSLAIDLVEALLTQLYEAKFELEKRAEVINRMHSAENTHNKAFKSDS